MDISQDGLQVSANAYCPGTDDSCVMVRAYMFTKDGRGNAEAAFSVSPENAIQLAARLNSIAREMIAARAPLATVAEAA